MSADSSFLKTYLPHAGLPPLAGIADFAGAARPGLSVETSVTRLKRHHWAFRRLHEIFIKRLTAEPLYELKMVFSLHAHYCAEHAAALRKRVGEMREPPLGLDTVPDAALDACFDEILAVPDAGALVWGIYNIALPALADALRRHLDETNKLIDHPSFRVCRFALLEVEEMCAYGRQAVTALVSEARREELAGWSRLLQGLLAQSGGLDASAEVKGGVPARQFSVNPPAYDKVPRRDGRFTDSYNMGVHAEAFLYDEAMPVEPKTLMLYYKRLREIDVPEMMASILAETTGKPWDYTVDMTRQLWDEARHAMMGEVGFVQAGIDWRRFVPVNFTWSLALNTQLAPLDRHAVLYYIEQGLMPKTGKRYEWETAIASGEGYAALIQDYDWADEVLHARIGRDWYVKQMGDTRTAVDYGDTCWSRVLIDWKSYIERGLTRHENWWPGLYREWCRVRGIEPDPAVLAFHTTYETARADLKELSTSG
ncbi:MAG: hypothetical protein K0R17_2124 [Rariglobus sp.]|jgi:hypothetical protein|nr:hypothetical protein [Rariglobus sp.]